MFLAKTPTIIKKYYPQLVWEVPNVEKKIYLTFDDGPIPEITEWVLDLLIEYNIKATFFCIGDNIAKHAGIYKRTLADGHAVGNHTFNHLNGWKTRGGKYLENLEECQSMVDSNLFRPPYGRIKKSQLKHISPAYKVVMWDVLSGDFDQKMLPEKCYENVVKNTVSGSIIVFHDSVKAERNLKYALPKAIEYLLADGFIFDVLK
jgi:peptidoglycan/xylan/chitin deacetylase (PgdA/CDA1 family)